MTKPKSHGGLGFKDWTIFNQALLAKQAWRLLEHPDSLCARLLKAKYYPWGNILDTAFSKNSSPCWQGIEHGLELLMHGIIWQVHSGTKIRIWLDNWLTRGNHKVIGKASKSRLRWLSYLIDRGTKTWKEDIVRSLFFQPDLEEVLQIFIPSNDREDFVAWAHEKSGIFSVRSA